MRRNLVLAWLGGAAAVAAAAVASPSALVAQSTTGAVRGYVRDASGAALPNAQVAARDVSLGVSRGTSTNENGFFNIAGLRPGDYELTIRRVGSAPETRRVTVQIGQTLDVALSLGQAATQLGTVNVVAQANTGTETRTSEVGTNISRAQIENLPQNDRNVLDLAKLVPGVTPTAVNEQNKFIAGAGQPAEQTNIFVDGASYKSDVLRGGVAGQDASRGNPFPQGAVQEFRVVTQNYKAEYQKAAGAIVTATTRTGGNQWEGDVFGYGIAKSYVAKDPIAARDALGRPAYERLQTGGSIGGPIMRDKLFFFGTYELNARNEPAYVSLGGDASKAPASLNLSQYVGQFSSNFRENLGFGKLTYVPSERNTFDLSANIRNENDFRGFGAPNSSAQNSFESAENMHVNVETGVGNWKYAGDRWLNEFQVSGQHYLWNPTERNPDLIGKDYANIIRIGGKDSEQRFTQNRLELRNDVTRSGVNLGGDHVFKGGASVDFLGYDAIKNFNANPLYRFESSNNYATPIRVAFGYGDPQIKTTNTQFGGYLQDDWTVARKLVLNLGIRWDAETNMINNGYVTPKSLADSLSGPLSSRLFVERPRVGGTDTVRVIDELGGLDRFISNGRSSRPIYKKAFQPRVGASYDLFGDNHTVLFAGAGVYYDRNYWNSLFDEQFRRQYSVLTQQFNDSGATASCPLCIKFNSSYYDPAALRAATTLAGTARPEVFLVANDLVPPKTYQMSGGVRQALGSYQVTLSYNGARGRNYMNFVRASPFGGIGPNYVTLFVTDDRVKTWYDAMQLQIQRPLLPGMSFGGSLAYTLARTEEQGQSTDIFWGFDDRYPTVADLPRRRAPGDQRHTIVANAVTRLPYEIMLSGVASLGSGISSLATDATRQDPFGRSPNFVFSPPTRGFLGFGHVFNTENLDLAAEKDFGIVSGQNVGIRLDLFNAFNSDNFGCYDTYTGTTANPNRNFGRGNCGGLGRRLQVGLRYGLRPSAAADMSRSTSATR